MDRGCITRSTIFFLSLLLVTLFPFSTAEAYKLSDFLTLLSNTDQCLGECEAILEIHNPTSNDIIIANSEMFNISFVKGTGALELLDYKLLKAENVTYTLTDSNCTWIETNETLPNRTIVTHNERICNLFNYTTTKEEYQPFNPIGQILSPGETWKIKLVGYKQPKLGPNNIDWILSFNGYTPDWAWWNSSWSYARNLTITESNGVARTNELVWKYVSTQGWDHKPANCSKEFRLVDHNVADPAGREVPIRVIQDFVSAGECTGAMIKFMANITAGQTKNYTLYYGNNDPNLNPKTYDFSANATTFDNNIVACADLACCSTSGNCGSGSSQGYKTGTYWGRNVLEGCDGSNPDCGFLANSHSDEGTGGYCVLEYRSAGRTIGSYDYSNYSIVDPSVEVSVFINDYNYGTETSAVAYKLLDSSNNVIYTQAYYTYDDANRYSNSTTVTGKVVGSASDGGTPARQIIIQDIENNQVSGFNFSDIFLKTAKIHITYEWDHVGGNCDTVFDTFEVKEQKRLNVTVGEIEMSLNMAPSIIKVKLNNGTELQYGGTYAGIAMVNDPDGNNTIKTVNMSWGFPNGTVSTSTNGTFDGANWLSSTNISIGFGEYNLTVIAKDDGDLTDSYTYNFSYPALTVDTPKVYNTTFIEKYDYKLGETITVRVNVTDEGGASKIDAVEIIVRDPYNTTIYDNAMMNISAITNGYTYQQNYTIPVNAYLIGSFTIIINASDTSKGLSNKSAIINVGIEAMDLELSGEYPFARTGENFAITAIVRDRNTGKMLSGLNVSLIIYNWTNNSWVRWVSEDVMTEIIDAGEHTGIYVYNKTEAFAPNQKGNYIARASTTLGGVTAEDAMQFRVDPPLTTDAGSSLIIVQLVIESILLVLGTIILFSYFRKAK